MGGFVDTAASWSVPLTIDPVRRRRTKRRESPKGTSAIIDHRRRIKR